MDRPRPAVDPELDERLAALPLAPVTSADALAQVRPFASSPVEPLLAGRDVHRREETATAADGTPVPLTVLSPADRTGPAPCVYWVHGGGMIMGDRFSQIDIPLEWLDQLGAVVVSVDHRLAPEARGTTLVEDCYSGLTWVAAHAAELGIDPAAVVVAGTSAGGGLAAGTTLMARDRSGPPIAAQVLVCPMLDHRSSTVSSHQYPGGGVWPRETNEFAWRSVLGDTRAADVPAYVSPARAGDLAGLPTTYLDAGTAEVFRDEVIAYAARIWAAGGQAELHVWAGGVHGFDALFPDAALSVEARRTRTGWLVRALGAPVPGSASAVAGPHGAVAAAG